MDEALTVTLPLFSLFVGSVSSDDVVTVAVLVRLMPAVGTETTSTGRVMVTSAPADMVPKLQAKLVSPALLEQAPPVTLPDTRFSTCGPVRRMPLGRVSENSTLSASSSPAPVLLRRVMTQLKSSSSATLADDGTLLTTSTSALVRTVVVSSTALFSGLVSKPAPVSSEATDTALVATPLAEPSITTVMSRSSPAASSGKLHCNVPPVLPTEGTVPQVPSAGTTCD